mgnify:CR=1 FL=1
MGRRLIAVNFDYSDDQKFLKNEARKFLEWLASASVQADFASINYEIPARAGRPLTRVS